MVDFFQTEVMYQRTILFVFEMIHISIITNTYQMFSICLNNSTNVFWKL